MGPRISFGMIVLNGEPFLRYNLRSLYPWAHQIIVVEGACRAAAGVAQADGHSKDGTLEVLRRFQKEEDPDHKLIIVTAEDENHADGFWPGEKHAMSHAYARRATGDWLWQVDVDEFYLPEDMERILEMMDGTPAPTQISFPVRTFSIRPTYLVDGYYLLAGANVFRRVFAWQPGFQYVTHRPPTVVDDQGRDLATLRPARASDLAHNGIFMYHYEQLLPKQVIEKCAYYSQVDWARELSQSDAWAAECYLKLRRPFHVHMMYHYPSWLERYHGAVPQQVKCMIDAIGQGRHPEIELLPAAPVDRLLGSPFYSLCRGGLKFWFPVWKIWKKFRLKVGRIRRAIFSKHLTGIGPTSKP